MTQYSLLVHGNARTQPTAEDWDAFLAEARQSGLFSGGSAMGKRVVLGDIKTAKSCDHIAGYMRFDTDDEQKLLALLNHHPVVRHGGSVALYELPRT